MSADTFCSCGESTAHIVARRETADGWRLSVWSDGAVAGGHGLALDGVPLVRPTTRASWEREIAAAWLFASEVSLYDLDEVPALYKAARAVARRGGDVAALRARMAEGERPTIRFNWQIVQADNRGDATVRCARLNRLQFPRLVAWHEGGRYELLHEVTNCVNGHIGEACESTGFVFASQRTLIAHLFKHHNAFSGRRVS